MRSLSARRFETVISSIAPIEIVGAKFTIKNLGGPIAPKKAGPHATISADQANLGDSTPHQSPEKPRDVVALPRLRAPRVL